MSNETQLREQLCRMAASLFDRGLGFGSSGNISVRLDGGWLVTPTGKALNQLDPARLARLSTEGRHIEGDAPSKEAALHLAVYSERRSACAIVHLHSTHSVAVSCLSDVDPNNVLSPITAYYVMRVGRLPLIPYHPPGDDQLVSEVRRVAGKHAAVLLANHGPIVAGRSLDSAVYAVEEIEETAKLYLLLRREKVRYLTDAQVDKLQRRYPTE